MDKVIYAVAQIKSDGADTFQNIAKHIEFAKEASIYGAGMIIFPELSLTGYDRSFEQKQLFTVNDARYIELTEIAVKNKLILIVGAPFLIDNKAYISSILIFPDRHIDIYIKKYLHAGEETFYHCRTDYDPVVKAGDDVLSFAICYDIEVDEHIQLVKKRNATLYAASIFYSCEGIDSGLNRLHRISKNYSIDVIMANYVGRCWNYNAGGRSSIWAKGGEKIVEAPPDRECLIIAEKKNCDWAAKSIQW